MTPGVVALRPLTLADVDAHNAGEDETTVRWLSGGWATRETTTRHITQLCRDAQDPAGRRGYAVTLDGRLAGYVEYDPAVEDGLEPGDVNLSYATHPWARGQGLAVEAVRLLCQELRERRVGTAAALRIDVDNLASRRVAEKAGFTLVGEMLSRTDTTPDGEPARMVVYRLVL